MFSLLKPTVSLVLRPYVLTLVLRPTTQRSPTEFQFKTYGSYISISIFSSLFKTRLLHPGLHNEIPTISATHIVPCIFGAESLD